MDQDEGMVRALRPFAVWQGGFTPEELDAIAGQGEKQAPEKATIDAAGRKDVSGEIRVTRLSWISHNPESDWIYDRLWRIGYHLNLNAWRFDLSGIAERLQYTIYESAEASHYDWHVDHIVTAPMPRKLSLVLQLSDPSDYEGCALQIRAGSHIDVAPAERGAVIAFPAYVLHRVTPIARGRRASLVSWISGPMLR